jgi:preprotein translocase subunit SecA
MRALERFLLLQIIDMRWREHLYDMDYLREGIGLRGFAQIEPLVAYKNEAFELFRDLMNSIWGDFARQIFHVEVVVEAQDPAAPPPTRRPSARSSSTTGNRNVSYSGGTMAQPSPVAMAAAGAPEAQALAAEAEQGAPVEQRHVDHEHEIGRNDPCWCGSGKKFKKCHGA